MKPLRVIILDFDGVLIESNNIKDEAFARVFAGYPSRLAEILDYHRSVTRIRFEKFRYVFQNILKEEYNPQVEAECARIFSEYSVEASIHCPWVNGAPEFLKAFYSCCPLYLASINPPEDLAAVLKGRGIDAFFKGVMTATSSKAEILREILTREEVRPNDAVFIGDSFSDFTSAREAEIPFVGRLSGVDLSSTGAVVFKDMNEIQFYLNR